MVKIHEQITPETWCKNHIAVDKYGKYVSYDSADAIKWCSLGWIKKVYGVAKSFELELKVLDHIDLGGWIGEGILTQWQDSEERTFEEIKAAFKSAEL